MAAEKLTLRQLNRTLLARGLRSFFGARAKGLDIERLIKIAKPYLEAERPAIGALRDKLLVSLFETQAAATLAAVEREGQSLLRFIADDADDYRVEFTRRL